MGKDHPGENTVRNQDRKHLSYRRLHGFPRESGTLGSLQKKQQGQQNGDHQSHSLAKGFCSHSLFVFHI